MISAAVKELKKNVNELTKKANNLAKGVSLLQHEVEAEEGLTQLELKQFRKRLIAFEDEANALIQGGACKHGAERDANQKCPDCKKIGKRLGPYLHRPKGKDVFYQQLRELENDIEEADELSLSKSIVEIESLVVRNQKLLRQVSSRLDEKEREIAKRMKIAPPPLSVGIKDIKKQFGVNEARIEKAADFERKERLNGMRFVEVNCSILDFKSVKVSVTELEDLSWLDYLECLREKLLRYCGRTLNVDENEVGLYYKKEKKLIMNKDVMSESFTERVVEVELIGENVFLSHLSLVECFNRVCLFRKKDKDLAIESFLSRVDEEREKRDLVALDISPFFLSPYLPDLMLSLSFRKDIQQLNLCNVSPLAFSSCLLSLENLRELNVSSISAKPTKSVYSLLKEGKKIFPTLVVLNLSGNALIEKVNERIEYRFHDLVVILKSFFNLKCLRMNACLWKHLVGEDDHIAKINEGTALFLSTVLQHPRLSEFEFAGNWLIKQEATDDFLLKSFGKFKSLSLCGTQFTSEEDSIVEVPHSSFSLSSSSSLCSLNLSNCTIGDEGIAELLSNAFILQSLEILHLSCVKSTGIALETILKTKFDQLKELHYNNNERLLPSSFLSSSLEHFLKANRSVIKMQLQNQSLHESVALDGLLSLSFTFFEADSEFIPFIAKVLEKNDKLMEVLVWFHACNVEAMITQEREIEEAFHASFTTFSQLPQCVKLTRRLQQ